MNLIFWPSLATLSLFKKNYKKKHGLVLIAPGRNAGNRTNANREAAKRVTLGALSFLAVPRKMAVEKISATSLKESKNKCECSN